VTWLILMRIVQHGLASTVIGANVVGYLPERIKPASITENEAVKSNSEIKQSEKYVRTGTGKVMCMFFLKDPICKM